MPRIIISGTNSGCGKTTIVCGIIKALIRRGETVNAFKVGPDYIDTMFHSSITGIKAINLDSFLMGEGEIKKSIARYSEKEDIAIIEGVMGYYDGVGGKTLKASTAEIGNITKTKAILIINIKGMSLSAAAMIKGYKEFSENTISGIIINGINKNMLTYYKEIIEENTGIEVIGCMPKEKENEIESRHLGLITAEEIEDLKEKIERLGKLAEENIDIDRLIEIGNESETIERNKDKEEKITKGNVKIAVARDRAFCFYYEDNLRLLEKLGSEIEYFSPIEDRRLPPDYDGIYIGGGYPELYLEKLSTNKEMIEEIRKAYRNKKPILAECGGFMYLQEEIDKYKMVGIIKGKAELTKKLSNFGYIEMTAKKDNMLCKRGETINGHEFHYSKSENDGDSFKAVKPITGKERECIYTEENLFCGYPHIHFYGNKEFAKNFIRTCERMKDR